MQSKTVLLWPHIKNKFAFFFNRNWNSFWKDFNWNIILLRDYSGNHWQFLNTTLLCHFEIHWTTFNAQRPDHRALDFSNCLFIISKASNRLYDYEYKDFLDYCGCKLIIYIYRITRDYPFKWRAYWVASKLSQSVPAISEEWCLRTWHQDSLLLKQLACVLVYKDLDPSKSVSSNYNKNTANTMIYGSWSWFSSILHPRSNWG